MEHVPCDSHDGCSRSCYYGDCENLLWAMALPKSGAACCVVPRTCSNGMFLCRASLSLYQTSSGALTKRVMLGQS